MLLIFLGNTHGLFLWTKKVITITYALQKILNEFNRKLIKVSVDKGSEFYNRPMKSWISLVYCKIQKNAIELYSIHNGGKSAVA